MLMFASDLSIGNVLCGMKGVLDHLQNLMHYLVSYK